LITIILTQNDISEDVIYFQKSNLNSVQQDEGRCYLTQVFGNYCGANADGNGCGKTVDDLYTIWKAELIKKGIKVCNCGWINDSNQKIKSCPECHGLRRIQPLLLVNEKFGNGLHLRVKGVKFYCKNINYFCKSCNMVYFRKSGDVQTQESTSFESRKSHEVRPLFINKLKQYCIHHTHICANECINKWSGSEEFKCSQQVLGNALKQELDITFDVIEIEKYGIKCNYPLCNQKHIIIKGEQPSISLDDYNAYFQEKADERFREQN